MCWLNVQSKSHKDPKDLSRPLLSLRWTKLVFLQPLSKLLFLHIRIDFNPKFHNWCFPVQYYEVMLYKSDTQSVTIWTMTTVNVCNSNDEGLYSCIISAEVFLEKMDSCSRGQQINQNKLLCKKKSYIHGGEKTTKLLMLFCWPVVLRFGLILVSKNH